MRIQSHSGKEEEKSFFRDTHLYNNITDMENDS